MILRSLAFVLSALSIRPGTHETSPAANHLVHLNPRTMQHRRVRLRHSAASPPSKLKTGPNTILGSSFTHSNDLFGPLKQTRKKGIFELELGSADNESELECVYESAEVHFDESSTTEGESKIYISHNAEFVKTHPLYDPSILEKGIRLEFSIPRDCKPAIQVATSDFGSQQIWDGEEDANSTDFQSLMEKYFEDEVGKFFVETICKKEYLEDEEEEAPQDLHLTFLRVEGDK